MTETTTYIVRNIVLSMIVLILAGFMIPMMLTITGFVSVDTMATVFNFYICEGFAGALFPLFISFAIAESVLY